MKSFNSQTLRKLQSIGIGTFVKYYYLFKRCINERSNDSIFEEFSKNNEPWNLNSFGTKASQGKSIFKHNLEKDVLEIIINNSNANRVGHKLIEEARAIYLKEF